MNPWIEKSTEKATENAELFMDRASGMKEHANEGPVPHGVDPEAPAATWKTALLVCGSALLGATAVALWNRRTLAKIQAQSPANSPDHAGRNAARLDVKEFF